MLRSSPSECLGVAHQHLEFVDYSCDDTCDSIPVYAYMSTTRVVLLVCQISEIDRNIQWRRFQDFRIAVVSNGLCLRRNHHHNKHSSADDGHRCAAIMWRCCKALYYLDNTITCGLTRQVRGGRGDHNPECEGYIVR